MLDQLFSSLSSALEGSLLLAAGAALVWGVLSILLSPCHLASIPLIIAFIGEQGIPARRRAFGISLVFAAGILLTIAVIGVLTAAAGRMAGDIGPFGNYLIALILLLLGLHFVGLIPMPWSGPSIAGTRRRGLITAFLLGLIFGIGVGPCTFAYMAPMLAVTFKVATANWIFGALLLLLYGIGHCAVIVLAGTSADRVQRYLNWNQHSPGATRLRKACGLLVILGAAYLVYTA